jgi:hypothetical protein
VNALSLLAHYSEPSDARLLHWVVDTIDSILGLGPVTMVVLIAIPVVAMPLGLAYLSARQRRRVARRGGEAQPEDSAGDGERDGRLAR